MVSTCVYWPMWWKQNHTFYFPPVTISDKVKTAPLENSMLCVKYSDQNLLCNYILIYEAQDKKKLKSKYHQSTLLKRIDTIKSSYQRFSQTHNFPLFKLIHKKEIIDCCNLFLGKNLLFRVSSFSVPPTSMHLKCK